METLITEVWKKVLGVPSVSPDDDIFSLGGDSFQAVRTLREPEERTGLQIPMHLVFEASGVSEFAAALVDHAAAPESAR